MGLTDSLLTPNNVGVEPCLKILDSIEYPGAGQAVADVGGSETPSAPVVEGSWRDADHAGRCG